MNLKKTITGLFYSPFTDGVGILLLYYLFFGIIQNPIKEFQLMQKGITQIATIDTIEGLDSNKSNSALLTHPYHYSFKLSDGKVFKSDQLIFSTLKDQPYSAKPKFTANITYLNINPNISQFTSTISTDLGDFLLRKILIGLLFTSAIYFILKYTIRYEYKEHQIGRGLKQQTN